MYTLLPYLLAASFLAGMVSSGEEETTPEAAAGTKRALVVAIGNYPEPDVNGYRPINALNDVPLIRATLLNQGFAPSNILVLRDKEDRRDAILQALHTLTLEADRNDVVVFHFSGHGDQITVSRGVNRRVGESESRGLSSSTPRLFDSSSRCSIPPEKRGRVCARP